MGTPPVNTDPGDPDPRPHPQKPTPCAASSFDEAEQETSTADKGYTATLLPQRDVLVNWMQTVSLDGIDHFEIRVVKK